jgi:hypothetical protein
MNAAHLCVGIGFALRGKSEHSKLLISQFVHGIDAKGRRFIRFSPHFFKNHGKGLNDTHRQEPRILYQVDEFDRYDPYNIITAYLDKMPKGYDGRFYLRPNTSKTSHQAKDGSGAASYNPKLVVGHNEIGKILKKQCAKLGVPVPPGGLGKWVPHGMRRTAVSNGTDGGVNGNTLQVTTFLS